MLFTIDQPRYQKALEEAEADVAYYQALAAEKRREAGHRKPAGVQAMSGRDRQSNNVLQTVLHRLAKAQATHDWRSSIWAYADPRTCRWLGHRLNVYARELSPQFQPP